MAEPLHISRNATPEWQPEFTLYRDNDLSRVAIVTGASAASDAALFAAAPLLLAALESALPVLRWAADRRGDAYEISEAARFAISTARES